MNVPNLLTLSRFFLTCIFGVYAQGHDLGGSIMALAVFSLAALTDWADGYVARKYDLTTIFGKIMDPVADKCLILTAFFIFSFEELVPVWMVLLIAAREILVTASRIHTLTRGQVIAAEVSGKIKTVFQMMTIWAVIFYRILAAWSLTESWVRNYEIFWHMALNFLMIVAVALTVVSGISYLKNLKDGDA